MSDKQTVQQAKDLLTLCLARAIDEALTAKKGPFWFSQFLEEDMAQEPAFRIARNGQHSVRDLDMQALLKILRYREQYTQIVLVHFDFLNYNDPYDTHTKERQIRSLLDRLITEFRNNIEAHSRVADIERSLHGTAETRLYGYREALQDMEKLSGIFASVKDDSGRSYHRQIQKLAKGKSSGSRKWIFLGAGAVVLIAALVVGIVLAMQPSIPTYSPKGPTTGNVYYSPYPPTQHPGKLTLQPIHVYREGDRIIAQCYLRNDTGKRISALQVTGIALKNAEGEICRAGYGSLKGASIGKDSAILWTFVFTPETISNPDADLTTVQLGDHEMLYR